MKTIFFAYQSKSKSGSGDNVDAILGAAKTLNQGSAFGIKTWEDLRNNGRVLINVIMEAIDSCDIFACDLTYMNHNVLFELGYAIAKNKILFLLINTTVENAASNFSKMDILRSVGYSHFSNSNDIVSSLQKIVPSPQLMQDLSLSEKKTNPIRDIFYVRNASNSQAELDTYSYLQNSQYRVLSDDSTEVEYRPFAYYLESIMSSNNIVFHITNTNYSNSFEENAKASLLAGFSCGKDRRVLLLAPYPYPAPIDYVDIMIQYDSSLDCVNKFDFWANKHIEILRINETVSEDTGLDLLKLGLGYDIAENEKDQLSHYFVETNAYTYAEKNKRAFFVGRKGTGKTAIYIMLNHMLQAEKSNFVIDLKPESSELIDNVEVARLYSSIAQKQSFFHSIWKFVIYSKLLMEISERIVSKYVEDDSLEQRIVVFVQNNETILSQHFLEIINRVSLKLEENALKNIYESLINPMVSMLKDYFAKSKYLRVAIIADNLDKTWDIKGDLEIQATMILSLFEVTGQIENILKVSTQMRVDTKVILFLRKDIFEYILQQAREPDKLILNKQEIDWSKYPDQLKKLIEKRFAYVLEMDENKDISAVWKKYFSLKTQGNNTIFSRISEVCIPRPRDLLMFMRHMFESAVNNGHSKVMESDFENALHEYSEFLYQNLIAEMISEYPDIRQVLEYLHNRYTDKVEFIKLKNAIHAVRGNSDKTITLIDSLVDNGYFWLSNMKTGEIYKSCHDAEQAYLGTCRKILFFTYKPRKTEIYANLTPQYMRL